jgi:Zn-finger nucleic acid-binding protein
MIVECPGCKNRYDVSGRPSGTRARCRCGTVFALPAPSSSAGQLSCPGCGAGVAPAAHRCEFCNADLLVRACPRCFARLFHGTRHCGQCGADIGVPARANPDGSAAARTCPACNDRPGLVARLVGEVLLDECSACHGLWLDAGALDRVVRKRSEQATAPLRELGPVPGDLEHRAPVGPPSSRRMYLACPDCSTVMNRVNFARRSGIILDVCRSHGTWFDADELPRVVEFVLRGGVEEAQKKDLEQARDEARRATADAKAAQASGLVDPHASYEVERDFLLFGGALSLIGRLLR